MERIGKIIKNNILLITIIIVGIILRLYKHDEVFLYNHDQDLIGWFIKDVVVDKHLRLIGQLTSQPGVFIGPLFYYYLIPFYLFFRMDPMGGYWGVLLLGTFTIFSYFFVLSKIFEKKAGYIAAFIYSVSVYSVFNDMWAVPTMPVFLWSVWYLFSLYLIVKSQKYAYFLSGILLGLVWNINLALIIIFPLTLLAIFQSKKLKLYNILQFSITLVLTSMPLLLFEIRHGFSQTRSILIALTSKQGDVISGFSKFQKVLVSLSIIFQNLLLGYQNKLDYRLAVLIIFLIMISLIRYKILTKNYAVLFSTWIILYISFFSLYSKILSEYYLDGLVVVLIVILSLLFAKIYKLNRLVFYTLIFFFTIFHLNSIYNFVGSKNNYVEKKALVSLIKKDSNIRGYPCVYISYITDEGYNLGYRYFLWFYGIKTKRPENGVPVYSIVFPHSKVDKIDKYFGSLGLILPQYDEISDDLEEKCGGEDYNVTEPMWGLP